MSSARSTPRRRRKPPRENSVSDDLHLSDEGIPDVPQSRPICFITMENLFLTPYIEKYLELLDGPFHIVYWNRREVDEAEGDQRKHPLELSERFMDSRLRKLYGYWRFRRFAKKIISCNDFASVVVLQTITGILLMDTLIRRYPARYVVDIRDYTREHNALFRAFERQLLNRCTESVISSPAYASFLPNRAHLISHNCVKLPQQRVALIRNREKRRARIRISLIGLVRFHEQNVNLLRVLGNDERFIIRFAGTNASSLAGYCRGAKLTNVEILDTFPPSETLDLYGDTDVIHNLYGSGTPLLDYALSNKLYYAASLAIPILVSPGTHMEEVSTKYNFGHAVHLDQPGVGDEIFSYYSTLDWDSLLAGTRDFLTQVAKDEGAFQMRMRSILNPDAPVDTRRE